MRRLNYEVAGCQKSSPCRPFIDAVGGGVCSKDLAFRLCQPTMGLSWSDSNSDNLPTGSPNNTYWRKRRTETTWQLREALLDGNASVVARLLGIDAGTSSQVPRDSGPAHRRCCGLLPAFGSGQHRENSMPHNYVYHPPPGPAAEPARAPAPNLRIIDFPLWFWCLLSCITVLCFPCVFVKVIVDELARRETSRETSPAEDDSCSTCRALDLNMHCWEDDCGMTALHYLALGRRQTPYEKMSFNFPAVGEHAIRGLAGSESIEQRKNLLLLLLRHGRLSPLHLSVKNSHGATALHAAACVGDVVLIETMIRKADDSYRQPTFDDGTVDTALSTPDGIGDWQRQAVLIGAANDGAAGQLPVDVAASHGHFAAARLLGLGLLTNIDQVRSLCATLISDCGLGVSRGQWRPTAGVVREDSDAVASSWALTSQGVLGAAAEAPAAVEVLEDDSARLEHLRLKERQLAAQLGMPTAKAGALLARHHFDSKLALDAHRDIMEASTRQGEEETSFVGENAEIVHTTHDEVRLQVRDDAGAPGDEECPVCFERSEVRASVCRRALKECGHFFCDRCLFGHVRVHN